MDIRTIISKLESIDSINKVNEANDPAEYARAQQQMANLEKAAKYTGDDPIVRKRMGLPPKLPPIEQWDGKMPQPTGKPDWVARLTTGGKALDAQAAAVATNKADDTSAKFKSDKLKQLNDLVTKLDAETKAASTGGAPAAAPAAGTPFTPPAPGSIRESLLREFSMDEAGEPTTVTNPAQAVQTSAPAAGGDLVSQIKAVMKELADMGDDPAVAKALQAAQAALDANQKAKASRAGDRNTSTAPATQGGYAQSATGAEGQGASAGAAAGAAQAATTPAPSASGPKGSKPVGPNATTQEKMDRFVYLMNKKKQAATTGAEVAGAQGKTTSESYFINKLREIELKALSEALTPDEEKELQTISPEIINTVNTGSEGIPPEVLAAVKELEAGKTSTPPSSAPATPDGGRARSPAAPKNPKVAEIAKILSQIEPILKKAGPASAPAAAPASAPAAAPATAAPAASGAKSGRSDPAVLKLQQDLIAKGAKIKADGIMGPATQRAMQQFGGGATPAPTAVAETQEVSKMSEAERYRALVNKLESINKPIQQEQKLDELVPAVLGIASVIAAVKGGSDYLDKLAASKQAAGNLKPEEVKQLADLINKMEELMSDEEVKKAVEADKNLSKRLADIGAKAKTLSSQATMAKQSTAQTIGGTVGAAVKEPFRMVSRGVSSAASAVGDFFKGAGSAQ